MANIKQAKKRVRQTEANNQHNSALRSKMRTLTKNTVKLINAGDVSGAQKAYADLVPVLDRFAVKGIIHKNKAARHKSRLNAKIKSLVQSA